MKRKTVAQDDIKEKTYLTKQIDTSITILSSPEDDVVLEALLFLSKYADLSLENLNYVQQHGILSKLFELFDRNVCILRLSLRLVDVLLSVEAAFIELDQEKYDEVILQISNMFVSHVDNNVKEFSLSILSKIASSCRIAILIYRTDLFYAIFELLIYKTNPEIIIETLKLLYVILDAPSALSHLPDVDNFSPTILINFLTNDNSDIVETSIDLLRKLTYFGIEELQKRFKEAKLMETMLKILMDEDKKHLHKKIISIITHCMRSEQTSSSFIESMAFLDFSIWTKTCNPEYILPSIEILEKLTKMPHLRQILFDLSVEESILFCLRSKQKNVLNKTCQAITNMSTHRYCCDRMITPIVIQEIISILKRNDSDEDVHNEIAMKTIYTLFQNNHRIINILYENDFHTILLTYLEKPEGVLSDEVFLMILEMINRFVALQEYQEKFLTHQLINGILKYFVKGPELVSFVTLEILTNFVPLEFFRQKYLELKGSSLILQKLNDTNNLQLFKNILVLIYSLITYNNIKTDLLNSKLLTVFENLPLHIKEKTPLIFRIANLLYDLCLPLKFFKTNRLEVKDKITERFYLITSKRQEDFPLIEILEYMKASPMDTIYIVDGGYDRKRELIDYLEAFDQKGSKSSIPDSVRNRDTVLLECRIKYGQISPDPFLPRYIKHIQEYFNKDDICIEHKVKLLAEYVDSLLCGPTEDSNVMEKVHSFKYHIESLKNKLGTNMIPIGYLRIGFHCERALLFKAIADQVDIPASFIRGTNGIYWNEVAMMRFNEDKTSGIMERYVVDLMYDIGRLSLIGSSEANWYCNP